HLCRNLIIEIPRGILLAPAIELPVGSNELRSGSGIPFYENRAVVADPGVVRRNVMEDDVSFNSVFLKQASDVSFVGRVVDVDVYCFVWNEGAYDLGKCCLHVVQLFRPRFEVMGPREPRGLVPFPLRRHPETSCLQTRCLDHCRLHVWLVFRLCDLGWKSMSALTAHHR